MALERFHRPAGGLVLVLAGFGGLYFGLLGGAPLVGLLFVALGAVGVGQLTDSLRFYQYGLGATAVCALALAASFLLTYGVTALSVVLVAVATVSSVQGYRAYRATA